MRTSEQINELAKALAIAQGELKPALKDSTNPHFRSKYADFTSVWDSCRDSLSKNGLSVIQATALEDDRILLKTRLLHTSGQWVESDIPLLLTKQDMQGLGSAITYARRYALKSIVCVADDDDDAETADGRGKPEVAEKPLVTRTIKNVTHVKAVNTANTGSEL